MIDTAIDAAKQAGALAYQYFQKQLKVSYKSDNSPVTIADREAEKLAKTIISRKFPDHSLLGEESGESKFKSKYEWVIDPIDGTRDFVRGSQFWCTLVAVLENGKSVIGVAFFPTFDEIFTAEKGKGCFLNGKKTKVSKLSDFDKANVTMSSQIRHFSNKNKADQLIKISQLTSTIRSISAYSYSLLLTGRYDICLCANGKIWDYAAPAILTQEAQGKWSNFEGEEKLNTGTLVLSNGLLHDQVLKILNS